MLVQELLATGQPLGDVPKEQIEDGLAVLVGMYQDRLAGYTDCLGRVVHCRFEVGDLIDHVHRQGLLTRPDPTISERLDVFHLGMAPVGHGFNELTVHVVDQGLQVCPLLWSHVPRRVARALVFADGQHLGLQMGPAHELAVVDPLGDDTDRSHHAAVIGINLVGRGRDVVSAAGAHGFDRGYNVFLLLIADAFDLAVDLFRRSHTATRRIDMNNDGFDGVVIAEFLNLLYHRAGVENDAFQFDHANLVPKTGTQRGVVSTCMQGEIDQRKHGQHEEEEGSPPDEYPKKSPRTSVFTHTDGIV